VPSVFLIPRRPTAIFYYAADSESGRPGSEPDEYNFLFGPAGMFRKADGSPFYDVDQKYADIIDRESDLTLQYLLRGEVYPLMFHQANLWRYREDRTLLTDLLGQRLDQVRSDVAATGDVGRADASRAASDRADGLLKSGRDGNGCGPTTG
jgi:hypothetical protein